MTHSFGDLFMRSLKSVKENFVPLLIASVIVGVLSLIPIIWKVLFSSAVYQTLWYAGISFAIFLIVPIVSAAIYIFMLIVIVDNKDDVAEMLKRTKELFLPFLNVGIRILIQSFLWIPIAMLMLAPFAAKFGGFQLYGILALIGIPLMIVLSITLLPRLIFSHIILVK